MSDSVEELQLRLSNSGRLSALFHDGIVQVCSDEGSALRRAETSPRENKKRAGIDGDVERRIRSMFRTQTGEATAPKAVRLDIADFLVQRLGAKLTADSLLMHLNDLGLLPLRLTGEGAVRQRIQALNQHYLNEVGALLINQTEITRQECGSTCTALLDGGKSVMLEGSAWRR